MASFQKTKRVQKTKPTDRHTTGIRKTKKKPSNLARLRKLTDTSKRSFLSLPAELRNEVYKHASQSGEYGAANLRFLSTCSQVHGEASSLAWCNTTFRLTSTETSDVRRRLQALTPQQRADIETLELPLLEILANQVVDNALRYLFFVARRGNSDNDAAGTAAGSSPEEEWSQSLARQEAGSIHVLLREQLPNLKDIVVPFCWQYPLRANLFEVHPLDVKKISLLYEMALHFSYARITVQTDSRIRALHSHFRSVSGWDAFSRLDVYGEVQVNVGDVDFEEGSKDTVDGWFDAIVRYSGREGRDTVDVVVAVRAQFQSQW